MNTRHRARKRFGQNFLQDPNIIRRIVSAIHPLADQHLVEIGPGQGAITAELVDSGCRLDLVELDRDLVPALQSRFGASEQLRIFEADALRFDYATLPTAGESLRLVGNLPYNISTPLIFHLLEYSGLIADMHFMLQREVVERMGAAPGSKAWGKLGVMTQYHCKVEPLFTVPATAFRPRPKVESAIVRLVPHDNGQRDAAEAAALRRVVTAAFSQRRKTLRNTLRDLVNVQQLELLGIDPTARAETLSLQEFIALGHLTEKSGE